MCRGKRRRHHNIFKFRRFLQTRRHKKYKQDLHKLRGLDSDPCNLKPQFRPSRRRRKNSNQRQSAKSDSRINIRPVDQRFHLSDDHRYDQPENRSKHCKDKLLYRASVIQPRDHDQSDADQHTHIIDDQF